MKNLKKIILAGGSGQIGTALIEFYKNKTEEIIVLTRGKSLKKENIHYLHWNGFSTTDSNSLLEGAEMLINLVGKNVNCRYNDKNKKEIFDSRTNSIQALHAIILTLENPPKIWIQATSSTIYCHSEDKAMTEQDTELGTGFSVEVCKRWENKF